MNLAAVRADVAVMDELLRESHHQPVDLSNPNWLAKLEQAPNPVDEAGLSAEAAGALGALLDAYEAGGPPAREEVREIFRTYKSFRDTAGLPKEWASTAEFRRRLIHISAVDQGLDPRDELMSIWSLCNRARAQGIDVEPVLRDVADLSSEEDHYGFGSMQKLIMRGLEEHDLDSSGLGSTTAPEGRPPPGRWWRAGVQWWKRRR